MRDGKRLQAAAKYVMPGGSWSGGIREMLPPMLALPRAKTNRTIQLSGPSLKPCERAVLKYRVQVYGFTQAYQTLALSKKAWTYISASDRSKLTVDLIRSGSRDISSCSRFWGSYGRETRSRIRGHCKRCSAGVVCTLGITEILAGGLTQGPSSTADISPWFVTALDALVTRSSPPRFVSLLAAGGVVVDGSS